MKSIYLIFSAILMSISGFANQSNFNGIITDDSGQELERAWVLVLNADDLSYVTGAVTDENGYFTIEGVEGGDYIISVHHISFDTPKIVGKWNTKSQLNIINNSLKLPSREAVSINSYIEERVDIYTRE